MERLIFVVDKDDLNDKPAELLVGTLITKDGKIISGEKDNAFFSTSKDKNKNNNPPEKSSSEKKQSEIYGRAGIALASLLLPLPAAIIVNAAPAVYSLYQTLMSKNEDITSEQLRGSAELFDSQLKKISTTVEEAKSKGYKFQPGHPQTNRAYILHPLSEFDENKKNIYIPSDELDEVLLQERESEMIRLFVMLGATSIRFEKEGIEDERNNLRGGCQAVSPEGVAEIKASMASTSGNIKYDKRIMKLSGREWYKDSRIDKSSFSWLSFEPSWEAIVFARENGGCISANLELKKKTSFSSNSDGKIGVGINMLKANIGIDSFVNAEENTSYNVYVEFSNPV